jgi:hypothetical protein
MYVLQGKRLLLGLIVAITAFMMLKGIPHKPVANMPLSIDRVIRMRLDMLLSGRANAIITGDATLLMPHYNLGSLYGEWAFEHEKRRCAYLKAWSAARGIKFIDTDVEFQITSVDLRGDTAWICLDESIKIYYHHESQADLKNNCFSIGTEHFMELQLIDGDWVIRRDWYLDPLDVDASAVSAATFLDPEVAWAYPLADPLEPGDEPDVKVHTYLYNRENAVAYANKYCGLARGCRGTNRNYNPAYKNYTGLGGDCTNFASQVLGDKEAGNLPMTYSWRYTPHGAGAGATAAWAQAAGLLNFLLSSGRGQRVARGTYSDLILVTEAHPEGAIGELNKGDLIAYEQKGKIVHFGVVVGADSNLYLLVNSHTADRYQAPWDLGWDSSTRFWLIRIVI